ncbi:MAG: ABC transporter permease [Acidimicrobiales bacterium]
MKQPEVIRRCFEGGQTVTGDSWRRQALPATITGAAALGLWQILATTGALPRTSFPSMTVTAGALGAQLASGSFWLAVAHTVEGWGLGLLLAGLIAIPVGLLLGLVRFLRESSFVVIEFLKPIPPVALVPLALLLWGPSLRMKLFLVAFGAMWPLLTQVLYGVRDVDPVALEVARSYRLDRRQTLTKVVLPSVLPFIATGLRVAASIALIVDIVAELVGGAPGLGTSILSAESGGALPQMYADIIFSGLLGLGVSMLFSVTQRPFLRWHPSGRA